MIDRAIQAKSIYPETELITNTAHTTMLAERKSISDHCSMCNQDLLLRSNKIITGPCMYPEGTHTEVQTALNRGIVLFSLFIK